MSSMRRSVPASAVELFLMDTSTTDGLQRRRGATSASTTTARAAVAENAAASKRYALVPPLPDAPAQPGRNPTRRPNCADLPRAARSLTAEDVAEAFHPRCARQQCSVRHRRFIDRMDGT